MKRTPILRKSPPKKTNPARRRKEWKRAYGSPERVEWVKRQMCWYGLEFSPMNCAGETVNAHTVGGGGSRKADADTVIPLCAACHERYDRYLAPFDWDHMRDLAKNAANIIESRWQLRASLGSSPGGQT